MRNIFRAYLQLLLAFVLIVGNSCQRNPTDSSPNPPIDPLSEKVTASLRGRVVDENDKPVGNATVKSGSSSTVTDINGVFRFDNIELRKNAGFVLVEKSGYLNGSRTFLPNAGALNSVEIQLIPKVTRGSFSSGGGGNITIQNGSTVVFPANSIINTATNQAYTGTVKVIGAYLDPTNPELSAIMPGNLTGITTDNQQRALQTFGMMAVELEGDSGEKLNIAAGKIATISMPIPASMLAAAPATIPLWYFDETKGTWIEEGSATKTGSNYVGTVKHFSFWNCDVPANFIMVKMKLLNQSNEALKYHRVRIINLQNGSDAEGYTDSTGVVTGAVPSNANLNIVVYNRCGDSIHSQSGGPYNANTDLGNISINVQALSSVTISGHIVNCSGAAVTSGFADIRLESVTYRAATDASGNYSIVIERCKSGIATVLLTATDLQTNQQGIDSIMMYVTNGVFNAPEIKACGTSFTEFIKINLNGTNINFIPPVDSTVAWQYGGLTTNISGLAGSWNTPNYQAADFSFSGSAVGTYPLSYLYLRKGSSQYTSNGSINTSITEYGSPGQFIAGSFSGNVKDTITQAILPVQCSFRVKRSN